ncbi:MAG TPA: inorganic phosphate transporter [Ktedonobacterales bacterium]
MSTPQQQDTLVISDAAGKPQKWRALLRSRQVWIGFLAGIVILIAAITSAPGRDFLLPTGVCLMVTLAYVNGANDVSKAIATLVGSGVTNYRRAILWGTRCTGLGSLCSALLASALIGTFTKGFIDTSVRQTELFALAVLLGAILWVFLANRTGLPVSTTHSITGSLVIVGAFAFGATHIQWSTLLQKVVLPLLLSPFLALVLSLLAYLLIRVTLRRAPQAVLNGLHWLSSGTASFARGLNDTPKIVALGVAFYLITNRSATYQAPFWLFALVALGMVIGSFVGGGKVTRTLAEKVTKMDHIEGFSANLTTAVLVAGASNLGLPVSTTHVSSGAIIGIGVRKGISTINWKVVRDMALAWVVTLPGAGLLGLVCFVALQAIHGW